jgi:long-chain acyl-CoA synthetase
MPRDTLLDVFDDLAASPGEFLVYDDGYRARSFTYAEVGHAARAFAARLQGDGIAKGDRVLFWSENRPEWIVALWGCLLAGAVAVPIDYRTSPEFLQAVARIVEAKLLLAGDEVPVAAVAVDSTGAGPAFKVWKLTAIEWLTGPAAVPVPVRVTRDDIAEIIFTSGATAQPKGVVITHRNVLANIVPVEREVIKYRKYGRPFFPLRFLNLLPLSHMFGQAMATFIPPMLPGTVIFMRGYNPYEIVRQIHRRHVSVVVSVPKILDVLSKHVSRLDATVRQCPPGKQHVARRWWRYRRVHRLFGPKFWCFVVGAAPLDPAIEGFWSRLGFLVVQGYGLTETAPIVSLNHPFQTGKGSVGKPIAGVEVKVAADGEILVRGENVTTGYYHAPEETAGAFEDGWFHTGDIGETDESGRLFIRGRKKEMIVTPEGLNVFPEDVERVVDLLPGVKESAAVGLSAGGEERVHVALVLDPGVDPAGIVRLANTRLADHQRIRGATVWPGRELPRTEGTRKLKHHEVRAWLAAGAPPPASAAQASTLDAILARYTGGRTPARGATIDELGLSSLERIEMMVALEEALNTNFDERAFAGASTVSDLQRLVMPGSFEKPVAEPLEFPSWNRSAVVGFTRSLALATVLLPLTRIFAWIRVEGAEHLSGLHGPVIFASNHQSHLDTPVILAALPSAWRRRLAPAMAKEFFDAHFFPERHTWREWLTSSLNYALAAFFFNAFPLPQREVGARQTLRHIGDLVADGYSVLIFPEGERSETGRIKPFRPGIGMIASRLDVSVVPIRLAGIDRVLHVGWKWARPGRVSVTFGAPLRLHGEDYASLAAQVEDAVRATGAGSK